MWFINLIFGVTHGVYYHTQNIVDNIF